MPPNVVSIGFLAELLGKSASIESPETGFLESANIVLYTNYNTALVIMHFTPV
jgi:hypothetical protein